MGTRFRRGRLAALLAVAGLLSCRPGTVQAHPLLVGKWVSSTPPAGLIVYDFGAGEYIGDGIWRGPVTFAVANCPVLTGTYELRMWSGTQGTLGLRDGTQLAVSVGNVDLGSRVLTYMNGTYRP